MNDYCLLLAKKLKGYKQTLVVHNINKQQFREALRMLDEIEDTQLRDEMVYQYGSVLI